MTLTEALSANAIGPLECERPMLQILQIQLLSLEEPSIVSFPQRRKKKDKCIVPLKTQTSHMTFPERGRLLPFVCLLTVNLATVVARFTVRWCISSARTRIHSPSGISGGRHLVWSSGHPLPIPHPTQIVYPVLRGGAGGGGVESNCGGVFYISFPYPCES